MDTIFIKFLFLMIIGIMIYMSYNLRKKNKELFIEITQEQCIEDSDLPGCKERLPPSEINDLKVDSGLNKLTLYWMAPEIGAKTIKEYVIVYYERQIDIYDGINKLDVWGPPHLLFYKNRGKTFCKYEILNETNNGPLLGDGYEYKIAVIPVNDNGPQKSPLHYISNIKFKSNEQYKNEKSLENDPNKEELIICQNDGTYNSYPNNDPNSKIDINTIPCTNNIQAIGLQRHEDLVNILKPNKKLNFNVNLSKLL